MAIFGSELAMGSIGSTVKALNFYHPSTGGDFLSSYIDVVSAMPEGGLWIGYHSGGVSFLQNGHITNFTHAEGLPASSVHAFANDAQGRMRID